MLSYEERAVFEGSAEVRKAVSWGVDAIITDYPAELIEYLKEKKLR